MSTVARSEGEAPVARSFVRKRLLFNAQTHTSEGVYLDARVFHDVNRKHVHRVMLYLALAWRCVAPQWDIVPM